MMLVFIRKSLEADVSCLETSERGIGLLGFGVSIFVLFEWSELEVVGADGFRATRLWVYPAKVPYQVYLLELQGVAVRLKVHDTTFCFVNSRTSRWTAMSGADCVLDLAAFTNALERRRADYQSLVAGLTFAPVTGSEELLALDEFQPEERGKVIGIQDSHVVVYWML
jgi:phosphatidylinositol-bisphosphatase